MTIEALCAVPPEALAHSPSQMPLSCLVAPLSQRKLHEDGGGGGGGEARKARGARAPKAKFCATSCGTSSATTSATPCAAFLMCPSFTCRSKKAWGAVGDDACHDEHLYTSVLRGARHALRYVPRHVLRHVLRRVLCGLVPHVLVRHVSSKGKRGLGSAAGRWQSVLHGAQQVLRHVLRHVLRQVLRRVLHVLVPHVLVLHVSPKGKRGVGSTAGRWRWAR